MKIRVMALLAALFMVFTLCMVPAQAEEVIDGGGEEVVATEPADGTATTDGTTNLEEPGTIFARGVYTTCVAKVQQTGLQVTSIPYSDAWRADVYLYYNHCTNSVGAHYDVMSRFVYYAKILNHSDGCNTDPKTQSMTINVNSIAGWNPPAYKWNGCSEIARRFTVYAPSTLRNVNAVEDRTYTVYLDVALDNAPDLHRQATKKMG